MKKIKKERRTILKSAKKEKSPEKNDEEIRK